MEIMIQILSEPNPDPIVVAATCSGIVNNLCFNARGVAQEICDCENQLVKDRFLQLTSAFIKSLALFHTNRHTDSRNEMACKIASAIVNCEELSSLMEATNWEPDGLSVNARHWEFRHQKTMDFGGKCAINMYGMHRTLQQQFAAVCFCYVSKSMTEAQREMVQDASGVYGWNTGLPMI